MRLEDWELTIQRIIDETNHEQKRILKPRILTAWRVKLEKAPTFLKPYQIDEIVREVRRRLGNTGR